MGGCEKKKKGGVRRKAGSEGERMKEGLNDGGGKDETIEAGSGGGGGSEREDVE